MIEPFLRPIFSKAFVSKLEEVAHLFLTDAFLQSSVKDVVLSIIPVIPFLIAVMIFAIQARAGFTLRGPGISPLYLPHKFKEVIAFVRGVQDQQLTKDKREVEGSPELSS